AVAHQRSGDRDLDEPDVPGPEREDGHHVHQQQDDPGGRQRRVDVERAHRGVDGEDLARPAQDLEEDRPGGSGRRPHHTEPGASPNRPTEKAEKTSGTRGRGGSIAEWITVVQARARAITERRFSRIATTTHSQRTALNALPIPSRLPRRHQNRPASAARTTSP